jgi:hypothetical protein
MKIALYTWKAEIGRLSFKASPGKKLGRPYLKKQTGCDGTRPVISATWETEVGKLLSVASPGKSMRPYLEKHTKAKKVGAWLKW